ncbi:hypothetical protein [Haloechinothrix alba]|nr:hypothetical protein [Haloechinothrix alba]
MTILGREYVRVYRLAYDTRTAALNPQRTLELLERRIKELSV